MNWKMKVLPRQGGPCHFIHGTFLVFLTQLKIEFFILHHTWGNSGGIHSRGVSLLANISQFPITVLVFPFAIPALECPTHFYMFHRRISFRKESKYTDNPSVNVENVCLTTGGNGQVFHSNKATGVLFFRVIIPKRGDEGTTTRQH